MNPLKLITAALLMAATFPAVALTFYSPCTDLQNSYEHYSDVFPNAVNKWQTGICPHSQEDADDPNVPLALKLTISHRDNELFSFLSFQTYRGGIEIRSSKGGYLQTEWTSEPQPWNPEWPYPGERIDPTYNFTGGYWTDLAWLEFNYQGILGVHDHDQHQFANFQFGPATSNEVPEPGTLGSLLIGVAGIYGFVRHRQWQRKQPNRPTMM